MQDTRDTKREEYKTYVMLIKYGVNIKLNIAIMILFIVLGIMGELLAVFTNSSAVGSIILFCAAMYPSQILMSTNLSSMVQASPYKKRLQTAAPTALCLGGNLAAMAIILLIRGLGAWMMPHRAADIMGGLAAAGVLVLGIDIFFAVIYKFFYAGMALYIAVLGVYVGWAVANVTTTGALPDFMRIFREIPAPLVAAFCLAMVFLAAAVQYLVSRAAYKRPFTKAAFGSNIAKKLA